MRVPPMLNVEVDGQVQRRPGTVEVLLYDHTGRPTAFHMRPQLHAGEMLCERAGRIPLIVQEQPCPN